MRMTSCKATILVVILKALKRFEDHQIFQITAFFSLSHLLCIHGKFNNILKLNFEFCFNT